MDEKRNEPMSERVEKLSDQIALQSEKIGIVADQLWKSNHDVGGVNSMVAGWSYDQLMSISGRMNSMVEVARKMEADILSMDSGIPKEILKDVPARVTRMMDKELQKRTKGVNVD